MSESLVHYGVKGMRWGVRKDRERVYTAKTFKQELGSSLSRSYTLRGSSAAGRVVVSRMGQQVLGPSLGKMVGGMIGGHYGRKAASNVLDSRAKVSAEDFLKDPNKHIPNRNSGYSDNLVKRDVKQFGPSGSLRINASLNSGMSRDKALKAEQTFNRNVRLVTAGAQLATTVAIVAAKNVRVGDIKQKSYGRAYDYAQKRNAARQPGPDQGLRPGPSGLKSKQNRDGSWRITSL